MNSGIGLICKLQKVAHMIKTMVLCVCSKPGGIEMKL